MHASEMFLTRSRFAKTWISAKKPPSNSPRGPERQRDQAVAERGPDFAPMMTLIACRSAEDA